MVVGGLLLVASAAPAAAQEARPADRPLPPGASLTQQVLLATYPELRDHPIAWRIAGRGDGVVLEAREAVPPVVAEGAAAPVTSVVADGDAPLVQAIAEVDRDGALVTLQVDGVLTRPAGLVAARAAANPVEALSAVAATYAPDVATADQLVPPRLAEALQATTAPVGRFQGDGDASVKALSWVVELDATAADGTPRTYTLTFEPVAGRLLSVVRR
jgi:hypothetical protein